jgi:amino acid permease
MSALENFMKIAGLIIGILLMVLSGIAFIVCLLLPSMTNNRVNFQEAMLGLIPAAIVLFLALVLTVVSLIFILKAKKTAHQLN